MCSVYFCNIRTFCFSAAGNVSLSCAIERCLLFWMVFVVFLFRSQTFFLALIYTHTLVISFLMRRHNPKYVETIFALYPFLRCITMVFSFWFLANILTIKFPSFFLCTLLLLRHMRLFHCLSICSSIALSSAIENIRVFGCFSAALHTKMNMTSNITSRWTIETDCTWNWYVKRILFN